PAGDKRLLSYAVDGKVTIDLSSGERRPVVKATIGDGAMRVNRVIRSTTSYRAKATVAPPPMLLEQPRRQGAALMSPDPKTVELTAESYRVPFVLPAAGEGSLNVVEEQPIEETIRLLDIDDNRLGALVSSNELDPKLRQKLGEIAVRRQAVGHQRTELGHLKEQRAQLVDDETRLRNDLAVLGNDPGLRKRLVDKFSETETGIETGFAAITKATDTRAATRRHIVLL